MRGAQQRDHRARRQSGLELRVPARVRGDGLHVVEQRVRGVHLRHLALQAQQLLRRQAPAPVSRAGRDGRARAAAAARATSCRIAELDPHQEPVELRFRQRERADLVDGILRRDHEERFGHRIRVAVGRDLVLLHRLEQRALRLRRGAIDLVGEHELCEHRPAMEAELSVLGLEHRDANDVGRQQVARELDPLVHEAERARERMRQRRLADARYVLDEQVAAREQAGEREAELPILAEDDLVQVRERGLDQLDGPRFAAGRVLVQRCAQEAFLMRWIRRCSAVEAPELLGELRGVAIEVREPLALDGRRPRPERSRRNLRSRAGARLRSRSAMRAAAALLETARRLPTRRRPAARTVRAPCARRRSRSHTAADRPRSARARRTPGWPRRAISGSERGDRLAVARTLAHDPRRRRARVRHVELAADLPDTEHDRLQRLRSGGRPRRPQGTPRRAGRVRA